MEVDNPPFSQRSFGRKLLADGSRAIIMAEIQMSDVAAIRAARHLAQGRQSLQRHQVANAAYESL